MPELTPKPLDDALAVREPQITEGEIVPIMDRMIEIPVAPAMLHQDKRNALESGASGYRPKDRGRRGHARPENIDTILTEHAIGLVGSTDHLWNRLGHKGLKPSRIERT